MGWPERLKIYHPSTFKEGLVMGQIWPLPLFETMRGLLSSSFSSICKLLAKRFRNYVARYSRPCGWNCSSPSPNRTAFLQKLTGGTFPCITLLSCSTYHPHHVHRVLRSCQADKPWILAIDATSGVSKQNEAERAPSADRLHID